MNLYIVRHGESEGNVSHRHQSPTERLSKNGLQQAEKLAKRFEAIPISRIISSTMTRAYQTAEAISRRKNVTIETSDLFTEIKAPTSIIGKPHTDSEARRIMRKIEKRKADPDFHHSDEENYWDFIKRVEKGLRSLEQFESEDHVVLVTHGHTLRILVGLILFGIDFSPHHFELLIHKIITANTGVTVFVYTYEQGWRLLTYNDHAHLLE